MARSVLTLMGLTNVNVLLDSSKNSTETARTLTNVKQELMNATRTPIALTQTAATLVDVRLGLQETAIYVKTKMSALKVPTTATCLLHVTTPRAHSSVHVLLDTQETDGTVKTLMSA